MKYSAKLLDYFHHCKHAGELNQNSTNVFYSRAGLSENSDVLELYVEIHQNKILKAAFKAYGTPALIGCAEFFCEYIENKLIPDLFKEDVAKIFVPLQLPAEYKHIFLLIVKVFKKIF